jgi:pyruvate ferredoxin oxidoreductase gamma subunit
VRIDPEKPVKVRAGITEPDVVVVLDPGLMGIVNVTSGLKDGGVTIINTKKTPDQIRTEFGIQGRLATVDATKIARELLGVPITNTTMVGAVVKITEAVRLDSVSEPLKERFGRLAEKNFAAAKRAYEEIVLKE